MNATQVFDILKNVPETNLDIVTTALKDHINAKDKDGRTPLLLACQYSYVPLALKLIENKADVNAKDSKDNTPLIWACCNKLEHVITILIEKGADVNAKDSGGNTPLIMACYYRCESVAMKLYQLNADINAKDIGGKTAVDYVKERWDDDSKKRFLDLVEPKIPPTVGMKQPEVVLKPEVISGKYPYNMILINYLNQSNIPYKVESGFIIPL